MLHSVQKLFLWDQLPAFETVVWMWHPAVCPAVSFHPRRFTSAADVDADVAQLLPSTLTFERQSLQMITFHQAQPSNRRKSSWFFMLENFSFFSFQKHQMLPESGSILFKSQFFSLSPAPFSEERLALQPRNFSADFCCFLWHECSKNIWNPSLLFL